MQGMATCRSGLRLYPPEIHVFVKLQRAESFQLLNSSSERASVLALQYITACMPQRLLGQTPGHQKKSVGGPSPSFDSERLTDRSY